MTVTQQSLEMETNQSLLHNKSGNGLINNWEGLGEYDFRLEPRTRWPFYPSSRTTHSSSSSHWQQSSDWKSNRSWDSWQTSSWTEQIFSSCSEMSFRLPEIQSPGNLRGNFVDRHTCRAPRFLMHSCCAVSLQSCCQSVQSHIDLHAPAWLKPRSTLSAFRPKTLTPHHRRAMSYTLQNLTPHPDGNTTSQKIRVCQMSRLDNLRDVQRILARTIVAMRKRETGFLWMNDPLSQSCDRLRKFQTRRRPIF